MRTLQATRVFPLLSHIYEGDVTLYMISNLYSGSILYSFVHLSLSIMVSLSPSGKVALDKFIVRYFNVVIITKLQFLTEPYQCIKRQVKVIEEKKLPCVTYGVSTVDDEEIYFNYGGFNSVDDPSSGEVNRDSIFRICSQTKLITHARYSFTDITPQLTVYHFLLQLAALQLIEKGKLQTDSPVSAYLPVFENPIILDDFSAEDPTFKPATKVVRVEHLLNFSSGLFYPDIAVISLSYTTKHDKEDPVGHFYNLIKVGLPLEMSLVYIIRKYADLFIQGDLPSLPLKFEPGTECRQFFFGLLNSA